MSGNRGCLVNSLLFLVIVFLPIIGHIIETVFILEDEHGPLTKVLWLLVIWLLPFVGPFLYLIFGQNRPRYGRVMFGQGSTPYIYNQPPSQY
jgi:Phospholipase_D-nuclease N-terminal